jgi:trans-aconitate methyltransferase
MTVSDSYLEQLKKLHAGKKGFGRTRRVPEMLLEAVARHGVRSMLDFGCGKGAMVELLRESLPNVRVQGWDPAFNAPHELPDDVDMIVSTDVLEHIETEALSTTLLDLQARCRHQYHLIACHRAATLLPDGRNAHLIVEAPDWWQQRFLDMGCTIETERLESRISHVGSCTILVVKYECVLIN